MFKYHLKTISNEMLIELKTIYDRSRSIRKMSLETGIDTHRIRTLRDRYGWEIKRPWNRAKHLNSIYDAIETGR
jgi:hypothetical protein